MDAMPRLAQAAAHRIGAGALNGRPVGELAADLGVSERHLRRAMEHEVGVSPVELAQTHRLLLAKRLLADTRLPVTRIAYASGFQSLRRFNSAFRERYRLTPSALRRSLRNGGHLRKVRDLGNSEPPDAIPGDDLLRLTLDYRPPLAWDALADSLRRDAISGVEFIEGLRYGRTVRIDGREGFILAEDAAGSKANGSRETTHLDVHVSGSLTPALMPVLARLRRLFDLDAEPAEIDACLSAGGLDVLVARRPGLRLPGAFDGFEIALRVLLRGRSHPGASRNELAGRIAWALGEPIDTGIPELVRLAPSPERVAEADSSDLMALGVPRRRATALAEIARQVADGALRLEPGEDATAIRRRLTRIDGVGKRLATAIVTRALSWPDAFCASDRALQRAAGAPGPGHLRERAESWRPWRAYAALHLRLEDQER